MPDTFRTASQTGNDRGQEPPVTFDADRAVAELWLDRADLGCSVAVNRVFDAAEEAVAASGHPRWFVLCRDPLHLPEGAAWLTFSRRLHVFLKASAMAVAHLVPRARRSAQSERRALPVDTLPIDTGGPGFDSREAALAHLLAQPDTRSEGVLTEAQRRQCAADVRRRMILQPRDRLLILDLRDLTIASNAQCDLLIDLIEDKLRITGQKWFFLIDLAGFSVAPEVWPRYAQRGRDLNLGYSLGTVRVSPEAETATTITDRAESQGFDPNFVRTREEGRQRLAEIAVAEPAPG